VTKNRTYDPTTDSWHAQSDRVVVSSASILRPGDTTQYTANDQVGGTALEFADMASYKGGGGVVVDVVAISSARQAVAPNQRLILFSGSPTVVADNATMQPAVADSLLYLGHIELSSWEGLGTAVGTASQNVCHARGTIDMGYRCATGQTSLWGLVKEAGTYTPVAAETFTYKIKIK